MVPCSILFRVLLDIWACNGLLWHVHCRAVDLQGVDSDTLVSFVMSSKRHMFHTLFTTQIIAEM